MNAEQVKSQLTRDDVVSILIQYGYEVSTKDFKFCLRDEKTPSALINQDCSIHDYGSDFHGDILDVLQQFNNVGFTEAFKMLKAYVGVGTGEIGTPRPSMDPKKEYIATLSDARHQTIVKTMEWYNSQSQLQTFSNPAYAKEVLAISPLWLFKQASKESIAEFKKLTTYDFKNKTLVIKIHDYEGKLISYKRRRYLEGKWITAKDTHPNNQCLMSIKSDVNHIYIVEGHHDYLTAVLLGIDVLMIPTVNYKKFTGYELAALKNREVILIPDHDFTNNKGVECMRNLALQVDEVARATKVFNLPKFLEDENISFTGTKLDLSDVVESVAGGVGALLSFKSILEYRADKDIFYKEEIF